MTASEVYRKTRKVPDLFWNAYVCRPIAALLVSAIEGTRITPNQITLSAVFVALASVALLLLWPGHWGLIAAVVVFELSYVLDCADGMLARWRGSASPVGHLLDFLMDELKAFCLLAAVAVRLFLEQKDVRFLLLGLFGLVVLASGIALTTFVRRPEVAGPSAPSGSSDAQAPRSLLRKLVALVDSEAVGSFKPLLQNGLLNAVNKSGAVSPATRAIASITPVAIPGAAVRSITRKVARHLGTPSPSAASRSDSGTNLSSSSVVRVTVGNISTASAIPPANAEKCLACNTTSA